MPRVQPSATAIAVLVEAAATTASPADEDDTVMIEEGARAVATR
jgi:hypothetical protein